MEEPGERSAECPEPLPMMEVLGDHLYAKVTEVTELQTRCGASLDIAKLTGVLLELGHKQVLRLLQDEGLLRQAVQRVVHFVPSVCAGHQSPLTSPAEEEEGDGGEEEEELSEQLFSRVCQLEPELAAHITGMLLELPGMKVKLLLASDTQLRLAVQQAKATLQKHSSVQQDSSEHSLTLQKGYDQKHSPALHSPAHLKHTPEHEKDSPEHSPTLQKDSHLKCSPMLPKDSPKHSPMLLKDFPTLQKDSLVLEKDSHEHSPLFQKDSSMLQNDSLKVKHSPALEKESPHVWTRSVVTARMEGRGKEEEAGFRMGVECQSTERQSGGGGGGAVNNDDDGGSGIVGGDSNSGGVGSVDGGDSGGVGGGLEEEDMEAIGERVYMEAERLYPGYAAKLTGMLLDMGAERVRGLLGDNSQLHTVLEVAFSSLHSVSR